MEKKEPHPSDRETPWKQQEQLSCCNPCGCPAARGGALPPGTLVEWEAAHAVPWHSLIPDPGGGFRVLSLGPAFGVEFYQQQLSKINKPACACQCERG